MVYQMATYPTEKITWEKGDSECCNGGGVCVVGITW